ncbi:MAG: MaoC family dehydratase [Nitrososphaeria archaeon]
MTKKGKFYEEWNIGDTFITPGRTVTETDIVLFAALTGDYHPIHTDEEYSKKHSIYETRIAHGLFTLSMSEGLFFRLGLLDGVAGAALGWNNVKFTKPVLPGDTLRVEIKVTDKRESKSRPDFGIVSLHYTTKNQRGEIVMEADRAVLVKKQDIKQ